MNNYDIIIVGAGASGLMCAITASRRGKSVLVLDHSDKAGKKILISGGGKCNFTNLFVEPENFISQNPHFVKLALSRYSNYDFIEFITKHGIEYFEKELGQLFCKAKSNVILDLLLSFCQSNKVVVKTNAAIKKISKPNHFIVETNAGIFSTSSLVIASGGASIPQMGASTFGYQVAKQFGINVITPHPGLVPLVFNKSLRNKFSSLAGVSCLVTLATKDISFTGSVLFTHRGISGPASLQISNYFTPPISLAVNLLPNISITEQVASWQKERPKAEVKTLFSTLLTKRIVDTLIPETLACKVITTLSKQNIADLDTLLCNWKVQIVDTEGFEKAEVTVGGVDTNEISSKTFESKKVKGLYFIGEVLDVTGWLGGYNFQWAWSSGYCCGTVI